MTTQEAYKTLDLAKGLGMDRVEAQFTKVKAEMESKIASTSNERLKQVYSNRLNEIEEAYAALIEHFEAGTHGGHGEQPITHSQSIAHQTKGSNSKWLLPAAIVFVGILVSVTLIFLFSSTDSSNEEISDFKEVTIGNQVWMCENLNVDKFRNGDPIPQAKTDEEWEKAGENGQPAWCYYDNDPANGAKYGKLYNWYAVNDSRGLAPEGWEIPSDEDWSRLTDFLGGEDVPGTKMKSKSGWAEDGNGTNESGFSGLPGGVRHGYGTFANFGGYGYWWSSSEGDTDDAWFRDLYYDFGTVLRLTNGKGNGFSVRCLRD